MMSKEEEYQAALAAIRLNVEPLATKPVPNISENARWYFQVILGICNGVLPSNDEEVPA